MDRFITPARRWPLGESRLHVYLLPEVDVDARLVQLVIRCAEVLVAEAPYVALVEPQWLHVTVQMVTGRPAAQIGRGERDRLVDALTAALADLPAGTLTVGSVLAGATGVLADVDGDLPGGLFRGIYDRVRAAIGTVLGPQALEYDTLPPHLTLGYGTGPGDSGLLQSKLRRRVRPSHAAMTVRQVHLLDVVQDAETSQYRWTHIAAIPLGRPGMTGRPDQPTGAVPGV